MLSCRPPGEVAEPTESSQAKRTQASMVRLVGWKTGASAIWTEPLSPSKPRAGPISPEAVAVAPPWSTPVVVPTRLLTLPSPGHQPTRPAGAGVQPAAEARKAGDRLRRRQQKMNPPQRTRHEKIARCGGFIFCCLLLNL